MDHWPQYLYLALAFIEPGYSIANNGKSRTNESAVAHSIAMLFILSILYAGGFFKGM